MVGYCETKRRIGGISCRYDDNIETDLKEMACEFRGGIDLLRIRGKWRVRVKTVTDFPVP